MKATVEVFVTHACPHCSSAEALVADAVATVGEEHFDLRIIDVVEELDHAVATGVLRTPAIAVNGAVSFTGLPPPDVLRRTLERASTSLNEDSEGSRWPNCA